MSNQISLHSSEKPVLEAWEKRNINSQVSKCGTKIKRHIDGPPFVSGDLHTGSLSVGLIKDSFLRYFRMNDYYCENKIGFDCHGLPSENMIMKILNLNSKKEIDEYGVDKFIDKCIETINQYSLSWKPSYDSIGRIVDFNNQYKTIDTPFMETVWWIFKEMWKKNLIYKAFKVMPHSYACETPLSNFEAGLNYKDVCTQTLYVKFALKDKEKYPNTYLVCWTTTPWTLPSNVSICVSPKINYVKCYCENGDIFIVSQNSFQNLKQNFTKVEVIGSGTELAGLEYEPLFDFMKYKFHKVLVDDYVTESGEIGTSLVHQSPAHGQDDCRVCLENNVITSDKLDQTCIVNDQGKFVEGTGFLEGLLVFDANKKIVADLNQRGLFVLSVNYTHSYPHCYRSETPLIYKITSSYFVAVSKITDKLLEMNEKINWINPGIKQRFKNWLENAQDWCISRNRYFGTPIPVWESEDGKESIPIGSIQELVEIANLDYTPNDLHLHSIKDIAIVSKKTGKQLKLNMSTMDCWFESGSVPYGQLHYPFENANVFDNEEYLCDFIAEGLDQTRGWFYTLLVISTIISDKPAFKNVICSGMILGKDGKKESKKNNNFVPPKIRIEKFGADSIRLYLHSSSLVNGEPVKFLDEKVEQFSNEIIHLKNAYNFYLEQKEKLRRENKNIDIKYLMKRDSLENPTDLWILTKLNSVKNKVKNEMDSFHLDKATSYLINFIEDITNWYIKLNRDRMKGTESMNEQKTSLSVLFTVLFDYIIMFAPFAPFTCDELYLKLINDFVSDGLNVNIENFKNIQLEKSVHLCLYPNIERNWMQNPESFESLKEIVLATRYLRGQKKSHSSQRVPINKCCVYHFDNQYLENTKSLISLVESEINALNFEYSLLTSELLTLEPVINNKELGIVFKAEAKKIKEEISNLDQDKLKNFKNKGSLMIGNNNITEQFLTVKYNMKMEKSENTLFYSNNDLMMILDLTMDENVNELGNFKNIVFHIQQARKKMELKPWNLVEVMYTGMDDYINKIKENLERKLKCSINIFNGENFDHYFSYSYFDFKSNKEIDMIKFFLRVVE